MARAIASIIRLSLPFSHADGVGVNRLHFTGRVRGRRLAPGHYRLSATPRNSTGATGATVSVGFTVVR